MRYALLLIFCGFFSALSPATDSACARYLEELYLQIEHHAPLYWPSEFLSSRPLFQTGTPATRRQRIEMIVRATMDPDSPLGLEIDRKFENPKISFESKMRQYISSHDLVIYSEGYRQLLERFNQLAPTKGVITDVGGGTGAMVGYLASGSHLRSFNLLDTEIIKYQAIDRLSGLFPFSNLTFRFYSFWAQPRLPLPGETPVAIMMNHVYAGLWPSSRPQILPPIYRKLQSGGLFIVNEPVREPGEKGREQQVKWLVETAESAIQSWTPLTEYDLAYFAAASCGRITRKTTDAIPRLTPDELRQDAVSAGFEWISSEPTYGGLSVLQVFRKP